MDNEQTVTAKQQLLELLRNANSIVITTGTKPSVDDIAAAIGLRMLLEKLDKVAEVVTSGPIPERVKFLPVDTVHDKVQGQRDFIVTIDQSRAEADHLKYDIIDGKIKLFVTPYSGKFTEKDVSYSYGDYHCDAVIGLGVQSGRQLDTAVTSDQQLLKNAQLLLINAGPGSSDQSAVSWSDATSSSVCEMIMSISEALGSGLLDEQVATALFTGILDKTHHFTNSSTTPKVMTMAAQLLAAGARQADVVKNLSKPEKPPEQPKKAETEDNHGGSRKDDDDKAAGKENETSKEEPKEPETPPNELQVRKRKTMQPPPPSPPEKSGPTQDRGDSSSQGHAGSQPGPQIGHRQTPATPVNRPSDKVESMQIPTLPPEPQQTPNAHKPADIPSSVPPTSVNYSGAPQVSPYENSPGGNQPRPQSPASPVGGTVQPSQAGGQQQEFKPQQQPTHAQPVPAPQAPPQPSANSPAGNPSSQSTDESVNNQVPQSSPQDDKPQGGPVSVDHLEAARKAVEEAAREAGGGDAGNQQ